MKIDFKDQQNVEAARKEVKSAADLAKFDAFLSEVKVFDMDNEDHVKKAKACCTNCCSNVVIGFNIYRDY